MILRLSLSGFPVRAIWQGFFVYEIVNDFFCILRSYLAIDKK